MAAICSALAAGEGGGRKPATYRPATAINKLIGPPQIQTLCARMFTCHSPYVAKFAWILVDTRSRAVFSVLVSVTFFDDQPAAINQGSSLSRLPPQLSRFIQVYALRDISFLGLLLLDCPQKQWSHQDAPGEKYERQQAGDYPIPCKGASSSQHQEQSTLKSERAHKARMGDPSREYRLCAFIGKNRQADS